MPGGVKYCLGCGALGTWDVTGRCGDCRTAHKAKYDAAYRLEKERYGRLLDEGACLDCPRCGRPVSALSWDLGHQDDGSLHPEHPRCNRGARRRPNPLDRFLL